MQKIIIDTDPGVDDAHAILLALAHPNVKVEAITTVNGNVGVDQTTANALKILDVAEKDILVFSGCASPLVNTPVHASFVHGKDGLGDCHIPSSKRAIEKEHAANALVRLANEQPGEITLVAIAPLTNLAVALRLDPDLPSKFRKLVIMGGAHLSRGNTTNTTAEFNFFTDPEAAHMVLTAWPMSTILTWETTLRHVLTNEDLKRIFSLDTKRSKFFEDTSGPLRNYIKKVLKREVLFAPDGLAMAIAIEPEIITQSEKHSTSIELDGKLTRGQICVDWMDMHKKPANAEIILQVDQYKFVQIFENGFK